MSKHESLSAAQLAVMKDVGYVQKKGKVGTGKYGYTYAGEAELIAQLRPSMIEHGIVMYPVGSEIHSTEGYTTNNGNRASLFLGVRDFAFEHVDSGEIRIVKVFSEASDGGDKRAAKAMTLAKKYALREFFLIETGDDPDAVIQSRDKDNSYYVGRAVTALSKCSNKEELDEMMEKIQSYDSAKFSDDQLEDLSSVYKTKLQEIG
jgi:hypothetical protein|tara:strand:+ start:9280 stop:9894 length:615 start_codon:yes stop_codon:yes gene_type:complete